MNNSYTDARMNLNDVCKWLTNNGYEDIADIMSEMFTNHIWTVDGMTRKDVIKEIFEKGFGTHDLFRAMECEVTTALSFVPLHEAHVD